MKKRMVVLLLFSGLLIVGVQFILVSPVSASPLSITKSPPAAPAAPAQTTLTLAVPEDIDLGGSFVLIGTLQDKNGAGIPDKSITFSIDGVFLSQTTTIEGGAYRLQVNKDLPAGQSNVTASFNGSRTMTPSSATVVLNIRPAQVKIETVPPTSGITFQMDGRQFISDSTGMAVIPMYKTGMYVLEILMDRYTSSISRVSFDQWSEESYVPFRNVRVPSNDVIQAGLNVFNRVSFKFVDPDGYPVDPQRINEMTIKSVQGDVFTLGNSQSIWMPASRTSRRESGLEESKLLYSVISVTIDGSNVVNQAQQRFMANPDDTWSISLLLYSLHVVARDGLFGAPTGKSVEVQYPDGQIKNYNLDQSGTVVVHSLARGIYHIQLKGTNGLNSTIPVALSRNQDVDVKVITYLDMGVVGGLGLLFALGLIIYGRPWLFNQSLKKKLPVTQEAEWNSIHEN
jgi:hypothetical protein